MSHDSKEHKHGIERHVVLGMQILFAALLFPLGIWVSRRGCEIAHKSLDLSIKGRRLAGVLHVIGGVSLIWFAGVRLAFGIVPIFDQRFLFGVLVYRWIGG